MCVGSFWIALRDFMMMMLGGPSRAKGTDALTLHSTLTNHCPSSSWTKPFGLRNHSTWTHGQLTPSRAPEMMPRLVDCQHPVMALWTIWEKCLRLIQTKRRLLEARRTIRTTTVQIAADRRSR